MSTPPKPIAKIPVAIGAEASQPIKHIPSISIVQSCQPKMSPKSEIEYGLRIAAGKAEKELMTLYPKEAVVPVILKLQHLLRDLNYTTQLGAYGRIALIRHC